MKNESHGQAHDDTKVTGTLFPEFSFTDTAYGGVNRRNNVRHIGELVIPADVSDCFVGMFRFPTEFREHFVRIESVKGLPTMPCYCNYLWFDIDRDNLNDALVDARQLLVNIELKTVPCLEEHVIIYFSGSKGFHVGLSLWLFGLQPSEDLPQRLKKLALILAGTVKIDMSIYERNRLWRVPNTKHGKSGLYKTRLSYDELAHLNVKEIRELAATPRAIPQADLVEGCHDPHPEFEKVLVEMDSQFRDKSDMTLDKVGAWVGSALESIAPGNRNDTFARIAGRLNRVGFSQEDIIATLAPHAEKCGFPADELNGLVRGICGRYPSKHFVSNFSPIYREETETISEFPVPTLLPDLLAYTQPDIEWIVRGILPAEGVTIIGGLAGHGKSWLIQDLAMASSVGGKWLGQFDCRQCRVLYIDEESTQNLLSSRFRRLVTGRGIEIPGIGVWHGIGLNLSQMRQSEALESRLKEINPEVIIIDSLIRIHSQDENSATEMAKMFGILRRLSRKYKCLIVIADHQRKPGQFPTSSDILLRGSSEKIAAADVVLSVKKVNDAYEVEQSKARFSEPIPKFQFSISGKENEPVVIKYLGESATIRGTERTDSARAIVLDHLNSKQDWVARVDIVSSATKKGLHKKILDEVLKSLVTEGLIERLDVPAKGRGGKHAEFRIVFSNDTSQDATEEGVS